MKCPECGNEAKEKRETYGKAVFVTIKCQSNPKHISCTNETANEQMADPWGDLYLSGHPFYVTFQSINWKY